MLAGHQLNRQNSARVGCELAFNCTHYTVKPFNGQKTCAGRSFLVPLTVHPGFCGRRVNALGTMAPVPELWAGAGEQKSCVPGLAGSPVKSVIVDHNYLCKMLKSVAVDILVEGQLALS